MSLKVICRMLYRVAAQLLPGDGACLTTAACFADELAGDD
jgi:hypothetical protein